MKDFQELKKNLKNTKLIIVSKKRSKEEIMTYYNLNERCFGENRADELLTKIDLPKDIQWHFIGHLQRNKVASVLPYLDCIESVDSLDLVKELEKEACKIDKTISILIQFNYAQEDTKSGLSKDDAIPFIEECLKYPHVKVKGTMCMGPHTEELSQIEAVFKEAQDHFLQLQKYFGKEIIHECSMGMSHDYPIALQYGSTIVRLGTILFEETPTTENIK